jgi:hypothetical protein
MISDMKARNFIKPGENTIVIFTRGMLFELGNDNTGLTGDWEINPNRSVDRVIIYHHEHEINRLYIGNNAGLELVEDNRYKIKLAHLQYIGETDLNWNEFAEGGSNPVRYLP